MQYHQPIFGKDDTNFLEFVAPGVVSAWVFIAVCIKFYYKIYTNLTTLFIWFLQSYILFPNHHFQHSLHQREEERCPGPFHCWRCTHVGSHGGIFRIRIFRTSCPIFAQLHCSHTTFWNSYFGKWFSCHSDILFECVRWCVNGFSIRISVQRRNWSGYACNGSIFSKFSSFRSNMACGRDAWDTSKSCASISVYFECGIGEIDN